MMFNRGWLRDDDPAETQGAPAPQVSEADKELEELKKRLDSVDQRLKNQPVVHAPAAQQTAQQPQQGQQPDWDAINKEYWAQPGKMVAQTASAIAQQAATQAAQQVYAAIQQSQGDSLSALARETARKADPEVFDALEIPINALLQDVPQQYRNNATVWVNAFNTAKGANIEKVMEIKAKQAQQRGQQGPSSGDGPRVPSARPAPAPKKEALSDREREFARKMRLTEDEYRTGKEFYANPDSMWKGVVTFDSKYERRDPKYDRKKSEVA